MFLSLQQVQRSLGGLRRVHPFFVLSFLVGKKQCLAAGEVSRVKYDRAETEFLRCHYHPAPKSDYFLAAWDTGRAKKWWVDPKYGSSGSQKNRTSTFKDVFLHEPGTDQWGWHPQYIDRLVAHLDRTKGKRIPAFDLAVWLYRGEDWPSEASARDIVERLFEQFRITAEERKRLFSEDLPPTEQNLFQPAPVTWGDIQRIVGERPPDGAAAEGGLLTLLELRSVGPAHQLSLIPGERLNLITGDNGLGKTFLLECTWWALSGNWAGDFAYPRLDAKKRAARISYQVGWESAQPERANYDWQTQTWIRPRVRPVIPGLLIYARVDGSFALWDPARDYWPFVSSRAGHGPDPLVLAQGEVWEGLGGAAEGKRRLVRCNGVLRDWVTWQRMPPSTSPFEAFCAALGRLSPPAGSDIGPLEPADPVRILLEDAREIPTLRHRYGVVPVIHESAAIRRIIAMAYLIVWAWEEHKVHSKLIRKDPQNNMVILVDEMEAHLHPQWQRTILPALMNVTEVLSADINVQFLIATHSPLVAMSVEPMFDPDRDKLFHLDLGPQRADRTEVVLEDMPFVRYGEVNRWLRSDVFELRQARSIEGEKVLEEAKALQSRDDVTADQVRAMSDRLLGVLGDGDEFWPRWLYFAEQHGVKL